MNPVQFNRLIFGLSAGFLTLSQLPDLPRWLTVVAAIFSTTLAAVANAATLPGVGPAIAKQRARDTGEMQVIEEAKKDPPEPPPFNPKVT